MSRNSSPGAVAVGLPETLENRLRFYSIAAAAAGVSVLALVQPTEAEVVITHKVMPVPLNGAVSIDINHDGIADFQFELFYNSNEAYGAFTVKPLAGGAVVLSPPGSYAAALKRDVNIGQFAHFSSKGGAILVDEEFESIYIGSYMTYRYWRIRGDWAYNPPNRYLGVKLLIDGETHYGWVRLSAESFTSAQIDSYAYETDPDTPICAREVLPCPAPPGNSEETGKNVSAGPSLGMLALGADGLALWRREALAF